MGRWRYHHIGCDSEIKQNFQVVLEKAEAVTKSWSHRSLSLMHCADTNVNTDNFSLFIFHKIINMWK